MFRSIDEITPEVLQRLARDKVVENRVLEFKESLPGDSDDAWWKFLKSITAFANTDGGYVICGAREDRSSGAVQELLGIQVANLDAEKRRIEQKLRACASPEVWGLEFSAVGSYDRGPALVVRVPKSHLRPHVLEVGARWRFFHRTDSGTQPMNAAELRRAFALSEALPQRIRHFRSERLELLNSEEAPALVSATGPMLILHVVPVDSIEGSVSLDLVSVHARVQSLLCGPIGVGAWQARPTFEGRSFEYAEGGWFSYLLAFSSGCLEAVTNRPFMPSLQELTREYELEVMARLPKYLELLVQCGIRGQVFVMLTLLNVRGYRMGGGRNRVLHPDLSTPIERHQLILPEVPIVSSEDDVYALMKPAFDTVWRAAGHDGSMSYDKETGVWIEARSK